MDASRAIQSPRLLPVPTIFGFAGGNLNSHVYFIARAVAFQNRKCIHLLVVANANLCQFVPYAFSQVIDVATAPDRSARRLVQFWSS
jgi:hypothetical protein